MLQAPAIQLSRHHRSMVEKLTESGWSLIDLDDSSEEVVDQQLIEWASVLGVPVPAQLGGRLVATLRPTESKRARRNSLSAAYSLGPFPCHMDTAHWIVPCRYILIACLNPGNGDRETLLLDTDELTLREDQRDLLIRTPFRIVNGRNSFFSTILQRGRRFVRYDPGCMHTTCSDGDRAMAVLSDGAWRERVCHVRWRRGMCLVIDNWRVLHGRGKATQADDQRTLKRAYVRGVPT